MRLYPFIVLEGLDGTGKTTTSNAVVDSLRSRGLPALMLHTPAEPYSLVSREVIENCSVLARFYFFLSAVINASDQVRILRNSAVVVCDRYIYSTLAYHRAFGVAMDVDYDQLDLVMPDLTILLDISDEEERRSRITARGNNTTADLLARDDSELIGKLQQEYARFPAMTRIEASAERDEIATNIVQMILLLL
jgi:dTMP kinase